MTIEDTTEEEYAANPYFHQVDTAEINYHTLTIKMKDTSMK